jgi:hypothetical protein
MRRRTVTIVLTALVVTASATPGAAAPGPDPVPVTGRSPLPAGCDGGGQAGTPHRDSEVGPSIAVDPRRPRWRAVAWQQDRWSDTSAAAALTAYSRDGGRSWRPSVPPTFSRCTGGTAANGGDHQRASNPYLSAGPDGRLYQTAYGADEPDRPRTAILASTSADGGRTWGRVSTLATDDSMLVDYDRQTVTADPRRAGHAVAVWTQVRFTSPAQTSFDARARLSRTTDGGRTWSPSREILDLPGPDVFPFGLEIGHLPGRGLVAGFVLVAGDRYAVAAMRSADDGATWSAPVLVDTLTLPAVTDPRDGMAVRTGELLLDLAVDPRPGARTVHLVWSDARSGRAQVRHSRSIDGGRGWSPAAPVRQRATAAAFTPNVAVDRSGRVGVSYYDLSADTAASPSLDTDRWFTSSADAGRTWSLRHRLTPAPFDLRLAPRANGLFLGDYAGLTATGGRFVAAFATTGGTGPTDVVTTEVGPGRR